MSFLERFFRFFLRGVAGLLLILVLAVAVALWLLRREETRTSLANSLLARISVAGASLTIEGIGFGDWGSVRISGARLARGDSLLVGVDTLRVKGDPLRFLNGHYALDEAVVTSGEIDLAALLRAFAADPAPAKPDTADGQFHLTLQRIRLRDLRLAHAVFPDSGAARVSIDHIHAFDGRFEMEGDRIEVDIDSLQASARTANADSTAMTLIAQGTWRPDALDAPAFSLTTERSAISGHVSMKLGGAELDLRSVDARIAAEPLDAADFASLVPQSPPGSRLTLDAQLKSGIASGAARLDADSGFVDVERFEVDLLQLPRWNGTMDLGPSAWSGRRVSRAHVETESSERTITVLAAIESPGGSFDVHGAITDPGPSAWIEVRQAVFRGVDLAAWSGSPAMVSRFNGTFAGTARGTNPETMQASGKLIIENSRFGKFELDGADVDFGLARKTLGVNALVRKDEAQARVVGQLMPWAKPLRAQGTVLAQGTVRELIVDSLFVKAMVDGEVARIDTLLLASPVLEAHGSGTVGWGETAPTPTDFRAQATLKDAAPLVRLAGLDSLRVASAELDAHVTGPVQRAQIDATLSAQDIRHAGIVLRTVDGRVGLDAETGRASFDVTATSDSGSVAAQGTVLRPRGEPASTRLELASLELASKSERWHLVHPTTVIVAGSRVDVDDARLESGTSGFALDGTIDRGGSQDLKFEARAFDLQTLETLLGRPIPDATLDATLEVAGSAASPRAGGELRLAMRTRKREAAILETKIETDGTQTRVEGTLREPAGSQLAFEGSLPVALSLAQAKGDSSSALVRKTDAGVDVRLSGQEIALTVLEPFIDTQAVRPRAGTVTIDVHVSGPFGSLQGNGSLHFANGKVELPMQNVAYEDISLEVLLEGDRARIPQLSLRSAKGTLRGSGEIAMSERRLGDARLQLKAEQFRAIEAPNLKMTLSGETELTRTSDALRLTGKLTLDHLEYFLDPTVFGRDERAIVLTDADRAMLIETFGPDVTAERSAFLRDALDIAEIDVTIRAEQNAWIRQRSEPRLAAELAGSVQAKKAPKGPFEFFGELRPIPGRGFVEQYGRRFELAGGEVILNGDAARTHFRIESTYEVVPLDDPSGNEVITTLTLSGTPSDYDLDLSSDQGLSTSEITTLIVTGSTGTGTAGSERGQAAAGTAVQASLTSVTGAVEEIAGEAIGLDVFQIRQDGLNGATLIAGKYAKPKFYVGLRQPMLYEQEDLTDPSEDRDVELELEYTASKRLQLNFRGEGDALRFFLRTSQAY